MDMTTNSTFFKTTPLGIYKTSTSGKIIDANPAFIKMLGFTSFDEIKNINLNDTEIGATYPRKEFLQRLHKQNSIVGLEYEWKKKDGSTIYVRENARVIRNKKKLLYYEGTIEDITDRKRTELDLQISKSQTENTHERLRFVDEILQQLTITMSFKLRVKRLASALVPHISDWCSIDIVDNQGESEYRIIVHKDLEKVKLAEQLVIEYPPKDTDQNGVKHVLQTGKPEIYPYISEELIEKSAANKKHKELLLKLDITSMIIVPLSIRQKVFGTLTVASSGGSRRFSSEDMHFLKDIANRASFLIDNARLYEQSQKEIAKRLRYENVLKERAKQQAVASKFGQYALTNTEPTKVMAEALRIITKTLSLKHTTFAILRSDEEKLMVRFGTGWDKKIVGHTMLDKGKKSLSGFTLLSRKPIVVDDIHEEHRFSPPSFLFDHDITSCMSVIVESGTNIYGVLGVYSKEKRQFTQNDINFVQTIANSISGAIERSNIDNALVQSEKRFRSIFNDALDPIMIMNNNGRLVEMNNATCEVFGYQNEELRKINIQDLDIDDSFAKLLKKIHPSTEQKKLRGECTIRKKDQTVKEIEYSAVSNITLGYHLVIVRDITERKEEEQRRNHFLGIASHELKNALAGVKSFTQLLERRLDHDTKNQDYVRRIDTNVDRLKRLIDDLMDLTKIRAGKLELMKEITDIKALTVDIVEEFESSNKTHTITCTSLKSGMVYIDKVRIGQVLLNLLRNAVKYSEPGTPITVSMLKKAHDIIIEIQDKGMGISKKDQKRIFELFFQAEKPIYTTTGMGIGLYISSEIIKMHGGTIIVQSKKGEGSTFSISLPLHV